MLIRREILDQIVRGDIDLVFRRWTKPTIRTGGTLHTGVGLLGIDRVDRMPDGAVTDDDALSALRKRLTRLDANGPWTTATLRLVAENPEMRAADLAASVGRDRDSFKTDVRKLKNLGLTESLVVGYRISPRGQQYLDSELVRLRRNGSAASPRESGSKNAHARRVGRRTAPGSD